MIFFSPDIVDLQKEKCSKSFYSFFPSQKTEQRYREWDNELISIQWQFKVKPSSAETWEDFPLLKTLSRRWTHADTHSVIHSTGSPEVLNWQHTVKTGLDANVVNKTSQFLSFYGTCQGPPQYLLSAITKPALFARPGNADLSIQE